VCIYGRLKLEAAFQSMAGNEALIPVFNYNPIDIICTLSRTDPVPRIAHSEGGSGGTASPSAAPPQARPPRLAAARAATGSPVGREEGGGGALTPPSSPCLGGCRPWRRRRPSPGVSRPVRFGATGSAPPLTGSALPEAWRRRERGHCICALAGVVVARLWCDRRLRAGQAGNGRLVLPVVTS